MPGTNKTRYSQGQESPSNFDGDLPIAPKLVLGQAIYGVGKASFDRRVRGWDWCSKADEKLLEGVPREQVANALVADFLSDGVGYAIKQGIDDEWSDFRRETVALLNNRLGCVAEAVLDDEDFLVEYAGGSDLTLSFEAWGGVANCKGPAERKRERKRFDSSVDAAIEQLFGGKNLRISHTFKTGLDRQTHFVWEGSVDYRFHPGDAVRDSSGEVLPIILELARNASNSVWQTIRRSR